MEMFILRLGMSCALIEVESRGNLKDNGIWKIRTNKELMALYQELDVVAEIKKVRLRWLGHVERMSEDTVIKKLYVSKPEGRRVLAGPKCDGLMTWRKISE
jgi:hypothetical protein